MKKVWRISAAAPLGEWVDSRLPARAPAVEAKNPALENEAQDVGNWTRSSFDLLDGVQVEHDETVPAGLFDEMFGDVGRETSVATPVGSLKKPAGAG